MFYDMHIGFAVWARRLENAAGRSNIKKTQQRRIDPDLRVPSIVTKANIPLENILIDKNDKENGVSLWLIARKYPAHLRNKRFHANLFPSSFSFLIRPEVVQRIETQTWNSTGKKKNFTNAEEKRWNLHKGGVDPENYPREYPRRSVYSWLELLRLPAASVNICPFRLNVIVSSGKLQR